jgi:hemoglobin
MQTVFEAAGGDEGLRRLAYAWHKRVMADEVVAHAFSHGFHPQHVERLAAYWAEALGGPTTYSDTYGDETKVVKMHSGNGEHDEMNRRAIACFDAALTDVGLANDSVLRRVLYDYFAWATTTTMSRYHQSAADVPNGLRIPRWSWDGLQQ